MWDRKKGEKSISQFIAKHRDIEEDDEEQFESSDSHRRCSEVMTEQYHNLKLNELWHFVFAIRFSHSKYHHYPMTIGLDYSPASKEFEMLLGMHRFPNVNWSKRFWSMILIWRNRWMKSWTTRARSKNRCWKSTKRKNFRSRKVNIFIVTLDGTN